MRLAPTVPNLGRMYTVEWVIKASKLCNLRCRYCYVWNELGDPQRVSLDEWRRILIAVRSYQQRLESRLKEEVQSRIVWHGGEPLLLSDAYIASVLALEEEVFGPGALERAELSNGIQTNLFALTSRKLDLLQGGRFRVGVSFDLVGGVRLDRHDRETESRVIANMERLAEVGVPFGAITVLAGHTRDHLPRIHDFFADLGVPLRILPVHSAPLNVPGAPFALSEQEAAEALCRLFVYWLDAGCQIPVVPLSEYLQTVLLRMSGLTRPPWNRRSHGDSVFLVNTDGNLFIYEESDAFHPSRALGNLFDQPIDEILESGRFRGSLDRSDARIAERCATCRFRGACDSRPLYQQCDPVPPERRCGIAYFIQTFIEEHLRATGFDEKACVSMLDEIEPEKVFVSIT